MSISHAGMTVDEYMAYYRYGRTDPYDIDSWRNRELSKLNIGCGRKVMRGWVNLDFMEGPEVIAHDITMFPWPFDDNRFDYVLAMHILEHVPHYVKPYPGDILNGVLDEIFRIMKDGGILEIHVPHPKNPWALCHMGHTRHVGLRTFQGLLESDNRSSCEIAYLVEKYKLELLDYKVWYNLRIGKLTDYHFRKYLKKYGEQFTRIFGQPEVSRLVFKLHKIS